MVTTRMQKFDELVQREIAKELLSIFPDQIVSVTQVHASKDLSFAKVWLSSPKEIDQIVKIARSKAPEIRKILSQRIIARRVPSLYFVSDKTEEHAQKIDNLLRDIKSNDHS